MRRTQPKPVVREFMTAPVQSLPVGATVAAAHQLMRAIGVRHVPVLGPDGGVAGVVSDRELSVAKRPRGIDPADVGVEEVMSRPAFTVEADTPLVEVAEQLARLKVGCAVVQQRGVAVGIFTTTDALRALAKLLDQEATAGVTQS